MKINFKFFSITTVWCWLGLFALAPLALVLVMSFLQHSDSSLYTLKFDIGNYQGLFSNIFFTILLRSLKLALTCTLLCLILAYPVALTIAHASRRTKSLLLILLIVPFWTSSLIRTYGILTLVKTKGMLNSVLLTLGIIHHPLQIIYSNTAVMIGIVYNLLPFMLLPLYSNMERLDPKLFEAARDLGASPVKIFKDILLPLSVPGIIAGTLLVFLPAMTLFYIPDLLGGAKSLLMGNLIQQQFLALSDWPGGCATSVVLTVIMLALLFVYRRALTSSNQRGLL